MSIVLRSLKNSIHTQISGKRTSLSSYAFFRKISAAKPGQGVTREGLQLAMLYLKINASEEQMTEAFNTLSHGNGAKGIHYQQFVKSIGNASKAQAKRPDSSRNHSNTNSVRSMFEKDKLNIAGISSSRKGPPTASQRSYLTARTKARTEEAATLNRVIDVEGHRFKVAEILGLVRLKCNGRNLGSAGVRRMWRQFRSLAGARTQGTITKLVLVKLAFDSVHHFNFILVSFKRVGEYVGHAVKFCPFHSETKGKASVPKVLGQFPDRHGHLRLPFFVYFVP